MRYETPRQKAAFLIRILSLSLDTDYGAKQQAIIRNIEVEELNKLAAKWLDTDTMNIVVVGDATSLKTELEDFNREIITLSVPQ